MTAVAPSVEVKGAAQLAASFRAAARQVVDCSQPNAAAADMLARQVSRDAPRRTGRLAGSVSATSDRTAAQVAVGAPYAPFLEYGTRYIRPRPFVRTASGRVDWQAPYQDHLDGALSGVRGA